MLTGPVPVPIVAFTVAQGRALVHKKLAMTQNEAEAGGWIVKSKTVYKCHAVGKTIVCSFEMRMRPAVGSAMICRGRVQVRHSPVDGSPEARWLPPTPVEQAAWERTHPKATHNAKPTEVVCE